MKKNWIIILIVAFSAILTLFTTAKFNNTMLAKIEIGTSSIYSEEEIKEAMNVVLKEFRTYPATLEKLWYQEKTKENEEWAKTYGVEEAIVLYSSFKTYSGSRTMKEGLNPNSKYSKWSWVLVRNEHDKWELKNWGQG